MDHAGTRARAPRRSTPELRAEYLRSDALDTMDIRYLSMRGGVLHQRTQLGGQGLTVHLIERIALRLELAFDHIDGCVLPAFGSSKARSRLSGSAAWRRLSLLEWWR